MSDLVDLEIDRGVAVATIDAPPINVMTIPLYLELAQLDGGGRSESRT